MEGTLDSMDEKVDGLRSTSYGQNGHGGTVGKVNKLQGAFWIITILLVLMVSSSVGFGLWNVSLSTKHLGKMETLQSTMTTHAEKPTHAPEADLDGIHNRMHERNGG